MIKTFKLYNFRNPSKFLFFFLFSLSALAGIGVANVFKEEYFEKTRKAMKRFAIFVSLISLTFLSIGAALIILKNQIIAFGNWYVNAFVYGKEHHRYSLEYYYAKVRSIYELMAHRTSLNDIYYH